MEGRHKKLAGWRALKLALVTAAALPLANCASAGGPPHEGAGAANHAALQREEAGPALRLARAARAAGDLTSALNLYRALATTRAGDASLAVELADTLLEAGAYDEAIDSFNAIAQDSPERLNALLGLARAHLALSEPSTALEFAERAMTIAPSDLRVLVARGVALDLLARHAEAQASYRAALERTPRNVAARNDLALSLALTGAFEEAVAILAPLARSANAPARVRQNLALIYGLMGDETKAAELSRTDLDAATTEANLRFFEFVREDR